MILEGQFLDFISPGLTQWEAGVLFTDLRDRGEKKLLLAALIARAQYKEAQEVLAELDAACGSGRKLSVDPTVRSLIITMSSCLPQLEYLTSLSNIRGSETNGNQHSNAPSGSTAESLTSRLSAEVQRVRRLFVEDADYEEESEFATRRCLNAHQFATPKGKCLPVQPSEEDKMGAKEFWKEYEM